MLDNTNPTHPDEIDANYRKTLLLEYLSKRWNVFKAAKEVGIERMHVYNVWMNDPGFAKRFDEVKQSHMDGMEEVLIDEGTHHKKIIPAIFMLKSHRPEIYDRNSVQSGRINGNITINIGQVVGDTLKALDLTGKAQVSIEEGKNGDIQTGDGKQDQP